MTLGFLPGDVNGDVSDVAAPVNHLHDPGTSPLDIWQADIDRSGAVIAADILREIVLLNGASTYKANYDETLPP